MANVFDVARYILHDQGEMTAMKLQKLCYYVQAWNLAWDDVPLFPEDFEAWANGPVCPALFAKHQGKFTVRHGSFGDYDPGALTEAQMINVDQVLSDYGSITPFELSVMTHRERPWREARGDTPPGERSNKIITKESMHDYYSGLLQDV